MLLAARHQFAFLLRYKEVELSIGFSVLQAVVSELVQLRELAQVTFLWPD